MSNSYQTIDSICIGTRHFQCTLKGGKTETGKIERKQNRSADPHRGEVVPRLRRRIGSGGAASDVRTMALPTSNVIGGM
ncbi:hypothetical protein niasHT_033544 [Heterodera trifolii]|uniref:Uncharacterized protein n=1 Tax=Heterodera trifolii TaxID=157864 RepID=A0ABD2HQ90_9BILA